MTTDTTTTTHEQLLGLLTTYCGDEAAQARLVELGLCERIRVGGTDALDLTDAGAAEADRLGLTVDCDAYGCGYVVPPSPDSLALATERARELESPAPNSIAFEIRTEHLERADGDYARARELLSDLDLHAEIQRYDLSIAEATEALPTVRAELESLLEASPNYGTVCRYSDATELRPATREELIESLSDPVGPGCWSDADGTTVYVDRSHDSLESLGLTEEGDDLAEAQAATQSREAAARAIYEAMDEEGQLSAHDALEICRAHGGMAHPEWHEAQSAERLATRLGCAAEYEAL